MRATRERPLGNAHQPRTPYLDPCQICTRCRPHKACPPTKILAGPPCTSSHHQPLDNAFAQHWISTRDPCGNDIFCALCPDRCSGTFCALANRIGVTYRIFVCKGVRDGVFVLGTRRTGDIYVCQAHLAETGFLFCETIYRQAIRSTVHLSLTTPVLRTHRH
jgi:hypothetical protein